MEIPLQIAFHKAEKPDWAENEIRARVDKLVDLRNDIIGCKVTVDQRAGTPDSSIPPVVRLEVNLPHAAPMVVAYEPDRLQQKFQTPDLRNAIHDAFGVAEKRLSEMKEQQSGRTKAIHHDTQNQFLGQIAELHPEEDHGFLMTKEGGLLYFHRNSLLNGDFDQLKRGDKVRYVEDIGDTGPTAKKVRLAEG